MTIKTIKIPVMPIGQSRIRYSTPASRKSNPVSVSKSAGTITIKIEKIAGLSYRVGTITIPVSMIDDKDCCADYTDAITWERKPKQWDTEGDVIAIDAYPTLTVDTDDCCQWQAFIIRMFGVDQPSGGSIYWEFRPSVLPVDEKTQSRMIGQNVIPPGGMLELSYEFWDGINRWQPAADLTYWCTCCFTGGFIQSISGQPGSQDVTYTVQVNGQDKLCRPSDYLKYSVGQWVFVGRLSSKCSDHSRLACKKACDTEEHTDSMMIIPIEVGDFTDGGTHQYIDYSLSEVPELFGTCLKAATIIDIDHALNEADVDVVGLGRLDGIPFFVHPPDSDTVDGGSALFEADNPVTVLYHEDFQYIIGLGIVLYWEDFQGPNIATNHPWDLSLFDFYAQEDETIIAHPANSPNYTGGWGSYCKIEDGQLKCLCIGDPDIFSGRGYNNIYLYLRADSEYPIVSPSGVMVIGIDTAQSPGIDNNTTLYIEDSEGKDCYVNITIASNQDPDDWGSDYIHSLVKPVPQQLSGTYTVNFAEIGLTPPFVRFWILVGSGTADAKLEIDYIDFL